MKVKLIVDNREIEIEITEEELNKLKTKQKKKTGYERVDKKSSYYFIDSTGNIDEYDEDDYYDCGDAYYECANYYSSKEVAENNARADKLMWQLRRFAVEHRKKEICLSNLNKRAHYICYDHINGCLNIAGNNTYQTYGTIYFDSEENAQLAINTFHDELIWYFTEYKDSL